MYEKSINAMLFFVDYTLIIRDLLFHVHNLFVFQFLSIQIDVLALYHSDVLKHLKSL